MDRITKSLFIFLLLSISISASIFMIIESGSFFQHLYKTESSISIMGYWAAFLNEVFMGIMAAVWLPGKKKDQTEQIHPVNILFKILLVFLFVTTVAGSSLNTVFPLFNLAKHQENQKKVIQVIQSQVKDNQQSLNAFVEQNQKTNTALSVRNQHKIKEELKQILTHQKSMFGLWLEILIIIFIRFGVQLANLSCIWLAGWTYRQPLRSSINQHVPLHSIYSTIQNKSLKESGKKTLIHEPVGKDKTKRRINGNSREKGLTTKTPSDSHNRIQALIKNQPKKPEESSIKKMKFEDNTDNQNKLHDLRAKIVSLLQSRNEGISLSEVGMAIGEQESNLREIVNPRSKIGINSMPALQNILNKIENLYNEEQIRTF